MGFNKARLLLAAPCTAPFFARPVLHAPNVRVIGSRDTKMRSLLQPNNELYQQVANSLFKYPVYLLSVIKFSKWAIENINSQMANFL
jgi:hypothetical protein